MKTVTVTVEVYDGSTVEDVERVVEDGLNSKGIDCTFNVEKKEENMNNVHYDFFDRGRVAKVEITEEPIGILVKVKFSYGSDVEGFWMETNFRKAIMEKCDGNTLWKDNRVGN